LFFSQPYKVAGFLTLYRQYKILHGDTESEGIPMSPCNAIAVQTAKLNTDASVIVHNDVAIEALSNLLEKRWETDEIGVSKGADRVQFSGRKVGKSVLIFDRGGIQVFPNNELLSVKILVEQIAGLIIQARVRQAVAAQYQILEEQQAPNGALVLTVEL
jgi:hypothetical protein